jgi:hypothetical protein
VVLSFLIFSTASATLSVSVTSSIVGQVSFVLYME